MKRLILIVILILFFGCSDKIEFKAPNKKETKKELKHNKVEKKFFYFYYDPLTKKYYPLYF